MSKTVVPCSVSGCAKPANYKIAAPWSDGRFSELKTYGHACDDHVGQVFRDAEDRRAVYRPAAGERVDEIGIYRHENGWLDWQVQRVGDLEEHYRSWGSGAQGV